MLPLPSTRLFITATSAILLLSGCAFAPEMTDSEQEMIQTFSGSKYQPATREMRDNIETQEVFAQAAFWSREYELNPGDLESAIKLSAAVRKLGNPGRAIEISQTARALYPKDPYLAAEFAAALVAAERPFDAMKPIDDALAYAPGYARLWSLKGAALDQQENYDLARKHYARALQITPNDPNIMANVGLSFALSGQADTAEGWLRRAVSIPGAGKNVHQNLALILQLQGKYEEAEKYSKYAASNRQPLNPQSIPSYQNGKPVYPPATTARTQARSQPPQSLRGAYNQPVPPSTQPYVQSSGNHMAMIGGVPADSASIQSASDAARAAARQSKNRREIRPGEQTAEQQSLLQKLARNVGPKARLNSAASPTYGNAYPDQRVQSGYPVPTASQFPAYHNQSAAGRAEARRRR